MEHLLTAVTGILSFVILLAALINWPSMAGFWAWVEFEGRIRKEARELLDRARAKRKSELREVEG